MSTITIQVEPDAEVRVWRTADGVTIIVEHANSSSPQATTVRGENSVPATTEPGPAEPRPLWLDNGDATERPPEPAATPGPVNAPDAPDPTNTLDHIAAIASGQLATSSLGDHGAWRRIYELAVEWRGVS